MKLIATTFLTLAAALAVIACAVRPAAEPCRADCRLTVSLPDDVAEPPRISTEKMHIVGGSRIDIEVTGGPVGNRATVLQFYKPKEHADGGTPFVNSSGKPLYRVTLNSGNRQLAVRPFNKGVCRPPNGCKYDIRNTGNKERPTLDPWIIIHQ